MGNGIRQLQPIFLQPIFGDSMQETLISFFIKQGIISDFKSMVLRRLIPNILDSLKKCQNLICVMLELLIPFVVLCELHCYYSQFAGGKSNHRWFGHIGSMWEHQDLNSYKCFLELPKLHSLMNTVGVLRENLRKRVETRCLLQQCK